MIFNKNIFHLSAIVMATCLIMGCKGTARTADAAKAVHTAPIAIHLDKEQVWQLTAINGRELKPTDDAITISFNPEAGTLRGQSSCNTYSADYTLSHSSTPSSSPSATLRLSNLTHTDIQCTEAQMNTEERFLALLAKANHLSLSPDGWTLTLSAKGRNPLVFSLQ